MASNVLQWLIWLHVIICAVYLIFFIRRGKMYACFFPFVLFFPHVWTIVFLIGNTVIYEITHSKEYDKSELILPSFNGNSLIEMDREKETNIVPVEEALLHNEFDVKRRTVIEVAKRDPAGYLEKLKLALLSDDTETAHYAASSISHLKREHDKKLREYKDMYIEYKKVFENRVKYIETLDLVIKSKLSVSAIIESYKDDLIDVLETHIHIGKGVAEKDYNMLLDYLIEKNKLDEAIDWICEYEKFSPENEEPLIYELKVNYLRNNKRDFYKSIEKIDNAGFLISQETIEMVKYWKGE